MGNKCECGNTKLSFAARCDACARRMINEKAARIMQEKTQPDPKKRQITHVAATEPKE